MVHSSQPPRTQNRGQKGGDKAGGNSRFGAKTRAVQGCGVNGAANTFQLITHHTLAHFHLQPSCQTLQGHLSPPQSLCTCCSLRLEFSSLSPAPLTPTSPSGISSKGSLGTSLTSELSSSSHSMQPQPRTSSVTANLLLERCV